MFPSSNWHHIDKDTDTCIDEELKTCIGYIFFIRFLFACMQLRSSMEYYVILVLFSPNTQSHLLEDNCCLSPHSRPLTAEFRSVSLCPDPVPIRCQSAMQMSSWLLLWCHFMAASHPRSQNALLPTLPLLLKASN